MILTAALAEFARYGLAGARVDRIARRARVNKAMIYYHFASKEALHQAVIKEHFSAVVEALRQTAPSSAGLEGLLHSFSEVYASALSSRPEFLRIVLRELAEPKAKTADKIADLILNSGLIDEIREAFRQGAEQGRLRPVDTRQAFVSFVLMNIGYFFLAPVVDRIWDIQNREQFIAERKEAVIDLFLNGVVKQ